MKPGFKQTEVGVIPEDWEVKSIRELGQLSKGKGIRKNEADSGSIPCIRYGELYTHHNDVIRLYNSRISEQVAKTSRRLNKGDILFAGSGETKEEIGKCAAFIGDEIAYAGGDILVLTPNQGDPRYFGYLFNAPAIARQKAGKGQGDAIVHITAPALSSVRVPLPPTVAEQEAIASALGDADALIESLERQIAKKRDVKQGAMQELLTARQRLPGFTGKWETKKFAQLLNYERPDQYLVRSSDYVEQGIPVLTANKSFILGYTNEDFGIFQSPPVIIFDDFTTDSKYVDFPFKVKSSAIKLLHARDKEVCLRYVAERMRLVKHPLGEHKRYYISEYQDIELPTPSFAEQTAIAAVLSDMDAELAALEAKLAKARAIKQGMMQELLTGRIRLK